MVVGISVSARARLSGQLPLQIRLNSYATAIKCSMQASGHNAFSRAHFDAQIRPFQITLQIPSSRIVIHNGEPMESGSITTVDRALPETASNFKS
jgi:hypothetical protein